MIHIDAHSDSALVKFPADVHHGNVFRHVAALPHVKEILQLGHRGINLEAAEVAGVRYRFLFSVRALRCPRRDAAGAARQRSPYIPVQIIDVDGLDPSVTPGTPVPVPEGLFLTEARQLIRELTRGRRVVGADVVEVLPDIAGDPQGITADTAVPSLALEAMACARGES